MYIIYHDKFKALYTRSSLTGENFKNEPRLIILLMRWTAKCHININLDVDDSNII